MPQVRILPARLSGTVPRTGKQKIKKIKGLSFKGDKTMKKIDFYPTSKDAELFVPAPKPALSYLPDWYKKIRITDGKPVFKDGEIKNMTVKSCMPYFDALVAGYIQETWCDIHISFSQGNLEFNYSHGPEIISFREKVSTKISDRFMPFEFVWAMPWMPKLENGYSSLIVSPINNFSLPFVNTGGVIDSDLFYQSNSAMYPFYIYKDFSGIIPCGTPMYQIIPIKRESWNSSAKNFNENNSAKSVYQIKKIFYGGYKKFFHKNKIYK
jgi:hypothetical protein